MDKREEGNYEKGAAFEHAFQAHGNSNISTGQQKKPRSSVSTWAMEKQGFLWGKVHVASPVPEEGRAHTTTFPWGVD